MSVSGLEKLDVWCKARDFAVRVHKELLFLFQTKRNMPFPSNFAARHKASLQISPRGMDGFIFRKTYGFATLRAAHSKNH